MKRTKLNTMLLAARKKNGYSIKEVHQRTHGMVSTGYISQLERGVQKNLSPPIAYALSHALNVPYLDIMKAAGYL